MPDYGPDSNPNIDGMGTPTEQGQAELDRQADEDRNWQQGKEDDEAA